MISKTMLKPRLITQLFTNHNFVYRRKRINHYFYIHETFSNIRSFSSTIKLRKQDDGKSKAVVPRSLFDNIEAKNKEAFKDMIDTFGTRDIHRRGHVEFIYAALRNMEEFGVSRDLETYKKLIDILPKGKYIPQNIIQAEFQHYPKQQQCVIDLLEQMENNGVIPDFDMEVTLLNIFGRRGYPLRKFWRMMYWMPKFKNLTPWPLPNPLPDDSLELAKLAIARIMTVDLQAKVIVQHTSEIKDALDSTWVVTGQSPVQQKLIEEHDVTKPVYIEGSHTIWLRNKRVNYFVLRAEPLPKKEEEDIDKDDVSAIKIPYLRPPSQKHALGKVRSVHEQDEGIILAVCATGNSSRDSLLSWIRLLEKHGNPKIANIPVVFTLKSPTADTEPLVQITDNKNSDSAEQNK